MLDFASHHCLSNHIYIMLPVLPFNWFPIKITGIVDEAVGAEVLRTGVTMNLPLLVGNDAPGVIFLVQTLFLILQILVLEAIRRGLGELVLRG